MQNLEDRERKRERKLKLKGLLAKTSEEEEIEKKSRLTLHSLNNGPTKLSLRKNSNLLEPIVNQSSNTVTLNNTSTLNPSKLPKLTKSNKVNNLWTFSFVFNFSFFLLVMLLNCFFFSQYNVEWNKYINLKYKMIFYFEKCIERFYIFRMKPVKLLTSLKKPLVALKTTDLL